MKLLGGLVWLVLLVATSPSALAAPGDLDPSFDGDGRAFADFPSSTAEQALAAVLQPDGKLVVAGFTGMFGGNAFALARFNTDGSLDTSFDGDGLVVTDIPSSSFESASDLALQADGKIVVAGFAAGGLTLARYNPNGSLDPTFDGDGIVVSPVGGEFTVGGGGGVVVQTDGKIVATAGIFIGGFDSRFVLVRFNPDGSLDASFDGDGAALADVPGGPREEGRTLVLQPDGKIVVAGSGGFVVPGVEFALARFNPNGSLDPTFDGDGIAQTTLPPRTSIMALALQPDGKIIAAGFAGVGFQAFALARYNPDGSLDPTFDSDGVVFTDFPQSLSVFEAALAVVVEPNGKIVAAGTASGATQHFALARYNPNGSLDPTFDGDGLLLTEFPFSNGAAASALVLQADGKLVAAGFATDGDSRFAVARYLGDAVDVTPPVITVPADITVDAIGPDGAVVSYLGPIPVGGTRRLTSKPFVVIDEGGDDGSCVERRRLADARLVVGAVRAAVAGAACASARLP